MGQTDLKPTAQGQVESSINDTINFIMAKVAAGEIDAATATELIAAARKDYESNVPVTTSAQQAVQLQQTANPYQADPQTAYAVPEMEPEQTPIDYGQFATSTNYPHTYDVEDSSDVDMDALSGIASDVFDKQPRKKLSRKERKARAKEMKKLQKESNAKLKANAKSNKSIQKQLKDRDKELSKKNEFARYRRKTAKDVTSFIGYNRMYEDGICEVEEGMFSSCICFEDTSYHSVREDAQKAVFTSICRLYDQFGADTLVQFNIINTPLLKEQIGHRKFFNPSSQLNVNAANDAAVFNEPHGHGEDRREGLPPAEGHRRPRCHRRPRGRCRRRIGDRRQQSNRRSVLRHHRSRRSHEDHPRRRRDLRKRPCLRLRPEQHGGGRRNHQEGYRRLLQDSRRSRRNPVHRQGLPAHQRIDCR